MLRRGKKSVMLSGSEESAAMGKRYGEGSFPLIAGRFAVAQHDTSFNRCFRPSVVPFGKPLPTSPKWEG
jgi:hypothetical protein